MMGSISVMRAKRELDERLLASDGRWKSILTKG